MADNKARSAGRAPGARPQGSGTRGKNRPGADTVEIRERLARLEESMQNVATKSDLAELRSEMKADMAGLRSEMKADMAGLRSEMKGDMAGLRSELKTDMAEARVSTIKWFIGTAISLAGAMLVIVRLFSGAS